MQAIVTCDNNYAISFRGKDLASIPSESKTRMKEIAGKTIIYDFNHVDALPGNQPVKGSNNLIYTAGADVNVKGAKCFKDLASLDEEVKKLDSDEVYIIHGEELYKHFLPRINTIHMTKIDYEYSADSWFENLDKNPDFVITADSDEMYCFNIVYSFLKYERQKNDTGRD